MERWQNKVAVVTGASSGIGRACFERLLDEGMIVVGLARHFESMEREFQENLPDEKEFRFHPLKCDVSVEDDIVKAFKWVEEKLGGVDVLINAARTSRSTQIVAENNTSDLKAILDVNVLAPALCTREAFRSMKKRGVDGHVIMINSTFSHKVFLDPGHSFNMYPPSKYAVTSMTEVLRQEFLLNESKIKVTSISPGLVDTKIIEANLSFEALKPEDVADAVFYCVQTPPHVQINELTIKPVGENL